MKTKTQLSAVVLIGLLGAGTALSHVMAADTQSAAATAKVEAVAAANAEKKAEDHLIIKTSAEGLRALKSIREARLAIFEGTPAAAEKLAAAAEQDLITAKGVVDQYAVQTRNHATANEVFIPIDASINLSEGFVATKDKDSAVKQANEHLAKGEQAKALEVLKLANIDVNESVAMIPMSADMAHIKDVMKLINQKQYYEANRALKAIEDSVIIESYDMDMIPVQGKKS